ncbi:MAG: hypothetical protein IT161_01715 [Bryobacterales bacterium]|nr:hypothetical protein [Bryobacterales bacterium]
MRNAMRVRAVTSRLLLIAGILAAFAGTALAGHDGFGGRRERILYVWAQDQAHKAPDFLAVVNFDEDSANYGKVIKTVPIPPPGNTGNEPHHCHLNSSRTILACGGLLSLLKGQNGIFFFDVINAENPRFLFSTKAIHSSVTDDFLPVEGGGFLITQMGAADGTAPGRVAEFDGRLHFVANHFGTLSMFREWPTMPPLDGFNPHGISARPDLNIMMTSDFVLPTSTLAGSSGPVLRGSVRIWDYRARRITKSIFINSPDGGPALGTMDVKMLPRDRRGYGYVSGMFDGYIYLIDPIAGTAVPAFDCKTVVPHVDTPVAGGMGQLLATPESGDRLIFGLFQAGQVGMLDATDRANLKQLSVVSFGKDAGPHYLTLSNDGRRLAVADYFLNQDDAGIIHFEGDHKIHVVKVGRDTLTEDTRFNLDFNTAFPTGPARPHGLAMK